MHVRINALDDCGYTHDEINARMVLDPAYADGWTEDDVVAGINSLARAARSVTSQLRQPIADLHDRHGCEGRQATPDRVADECAIEHGVDSDGAWFTVNVPHELAAAWLDRIAAMFRNHLEETP